MVRRLVLVEIGRAAEAIVHGHDQIEALGDRGPVPLKRWVRAREGAGDDHGPWQHGVKRLPQPAYGLGHAGADAAVGAHELKVEHDLGARGDG